MTCKYSVNNYEYNFEPYQPVLMARFSYFVIGKKSLHEVL